VMADYATGGFDPKRPCASMVAVHKQKGKKKNSARTPMEKKTI